MALFRKEPNENTGLGWRRGLSETGIGPRGRAFDLLLIRSRWKVEL